jgi:hypothetical protein
VQEIATERDRLAEAVNDYFNPDKTGTHKTAFQTILELAKLKYGMEFTPGNPYRVLPRERSSFVNLVANRQGSKQVITRR